jgi:hypothetical protein
MRNGFFLIFILVFLPVWADVKLIKITEDEPISLEEVAEPIINRLNAAPSQKPVFDVGLVLILDDLKYYIKPSIFMSKSKPDEVCTPTSAVLAYQCKEGQRFVKGCHLLFFDAQGKWVGWYTLETHEKSPNYCNAIPALGIANKSKNELLITIQYFFVDGSGAIKTSELGSDWSRMTKLFRVKANNGKIEVSEDDSCLRNPNKLDTIAKARKQLQNCAVNSK